MCFLRYLCKGPSGASSITSITVVSLQIPVKRIEEIEKLHYRMQIWLKKNNKKIKKLKKKSKMFESFHLKWKLSNILPYKLQAFFNFSILGHHFSCCFYIVSKFSMLWFICLKLKIEQCSLSSREQYLFLGSQPLL